MKKPLILFILTVGLFACSNNSNEINSEEQIINFEVQAKDFFCGPGHHLELTFFDELVLFQKGGAKKGTCGDGFGFCFGINFGWNIECVRNEVATVANSDNVFYDRDSQEMNALGIADPSTKELTIYFHEDVEGSPNHYPSDFATLDVGAGVNFNGIELVNGSYPKIVDGIFFKYIVPYVEK
jgi:hypothetical protein